jgi:hypothetical protein
MPFLVDAGLPPQVARGGQNAAGAASGNELRGAAKNLEVN